MSNITKHESAALAVVEEKTLVSYLDAMGLAQKLDQKEKTQFLQIAQASNLNPFKREIYAVKYGNNMSIMTGYEVYIKRAERSGQLNGWKARTEGSVKNGDLKAIVTIYRKDQEVPFEWEAIYEEYNQNNNFWRSKPMTMIKKVAIAQAFRLCFSEELGGMPYTSDEIETQTVDTHYQEVKQEAAPAPKQEEAGASVKQKTELLTLLNNKFIDAKEKAGMLESINGMSESRIEKAIAKIKAAIEDRKQQAEKPEPEIEDAVMADDESATQEEKAAAPENPITNGQKDVLKPILSSPFLTDEEKKKVQSKIDAGTMSKEDASKTIEVLMKWIKERKLKKEAA